MRIFVSLALSTAFLAPILVAQKSPAPPPPPSTPPGRSPSSVPSNVDPNQRRDELVVFLQGRVATNDGTPVPNNAMVERVCNNYVLQQVYASPRGDFSMQLGSRTDSFVDATGDSSSQSAVPTKDSTMGIPRTALTKCELRASVSGFRASAVNLVDLDTFGGRIDVGVIVVERGAKVEGTTLDATPYKAPNEARKAYQKGLEAERKANLASARKYFETAVKIYPKYISAWFQLGKVLQKQKQTDEARSAYTQAAAIDPKFLPPYLSLASLAYEERDWIELLTLTDYILDRHPLKHVDANDYIVDLDPLDCTEAYFYNAFANYKLNNMAAAERSGLKAEHVDLLTRFPQMHLLMGEIFARKNDYATAISELQTYLALVPQTNDAAQVREQLADLEKLNASASTTDKRDHQ